MRIGVNGRFYGAPATGVQRFARELTRALAEGADVRVLLPADAPDDAAEDGHTPSLRGRLRGVAWEQLELPGQARRAGLDVVLHPANAAPVRGGPNVVVLHDVTPWTHPETFTLRYRTWCRVAHGRSARAAAALVTVSDEAAAAMERVLGIDRARIRVALQGAAPLDAPPTAEAVDAVRARLNLPERWFLAVGADRRKGTDLLRGLWAGPGAPAEPLVVVGRRVGRVHGPDRVPTGGRGGGLAEPVRPVRDVGVVDDATLRALYGGAVALLFPTLGEGFGRPPLEALACGTRALSEPCPSARLLDPHVDIVRGGVEAWRGAVAEVARESPSLRTRRVAAGRAAAAGFTWSRTAETVLAACRDAVGRGGRAGAADGARGVPTERAPT
ncbi:MAG TPA: glycosyltransferase family 1 protein [Longimicrobiales bacterium]|nr:glycosyltransferase family 1 protein [Longimicrobiales bacterium]